MRTDGTTLLAVTATALLFAVWLSAAAVSVRATVEPLAPDAHDSHASMIERMRQDVDPRMVEQMNEPEWREMRRPEMLTEMEAHQRATDRMLGRTP